MSWKSSRFKNIYPNQVLIRESVPPTSWYVKTNRAHYLGTCPNLITGSFLLKFHCVGMIDEIIGHMTEQRLRPLDSLWS